MAIHVPGVRWGAGVGKGALGKKSTALKDWSLQRESKPEV